MKGIVCCTCGSEPGVDLFNDTLKLIDGGQPGFKSVDAIHLKHETSKGLHFVSTFAQYPSITA